MPKPPAVPHAEIFSKIGHLVFWDTNGHIKKKNDAVWIEAKTALDNRMSILYLYIYIKNNRNNIVNQIIQKYGLDLSTTQNESCSLHDTVDSNWSTEETSGRLPFKSLRSTITLVESSWKLIEPRLVQYDGEQKYKLQPGWTDVLYKLIWDQLKLPCPFAFHFESVKMSDGNYLTVNAYCNECGNVLHVYAVRPPDPDLILHVSTCDTRRVIHRTKRQLKGTERKVVAKELAAGTSTYSLRRQVAREGMAFGDPEPAHLYNESVYRKAKQQLIDQELGVRGFVDPILSIQKLKYDPEYSSFIREVGLDKFYVIYFSDHQIDLYKRWLNDPKESHLSVDSTGSMWAPIKRPDGDSQELQLYQMVVPFCGKILPVCQLITEKHDAVFIGYWLKEWLRHDLPVPKSIVSDFSLALLNACAMAFNQKRLGKYLDDCIRYLTADPGSIIFDAPECLILLDIAHLMKLITRWSCWAGAKSKKEFFTRAIGLLTKVTTLDCFSTTVRDILLVAMSEYSSFDGDNNCTAATKRLLSAITTDALPYELPDLEIGETEFPQEIHSECEGYKLTTQFVNDLIQETEKMISPGPIANPYYCVQFLKNFQSLMKYFPIWTNVMPNNSTPVSSSARSEEYFRELKRLSLVDKKKRVDKALVKHMQNIQGTVKLLCAAHEKNVELTKQKKTIKNKTIKDADPVKLKVQPDHSKLSARGSLSSEVTNGEDWGDGGTEHTNDESRNVRIKSPTRYYRSVTLSGSSSNDNESSGTESDKENECANPPDVSFNSDKTVRSPLKEFNLSTPRNSTEMKPKDHPMNSPTETFRTLDDPLVDNADSPVWKLTRPRRRKVILSESDNEEQHDNTPQNSLKPDRIDQNVLNSSSPVWNNEEPSASIQRSKIIHDERQQDLNAVDDWMGKLGKDAKKRGHYLTPCPDFLSRRKRPPQKKKLPVLKNGFMCSALQINGKSVTLTYTCPFDCLAQSLLIGYRDWSEYRKCVDESDNEFFKFIRCLDGTQRPGQAIYKQRAMILQKVAKTVGGIMNCDMNIGSLIKTLLMTAEPSVKISTTCNHCHHESTKDEVIIEIPFGPVHQSGMSSLQNIIEQRIRGLKKCRLCASKDLECRKLPGKNLFIDIEVCMSIQLAKTWGCDSWDGHFTLAQLPVQLEICHKTYMLIAAIEYDGLIDQQTTKPKIGH